jgi:hypothetical protein
MNASTGNSRRCPWHHLFPGEALGVIFRGMWVPWTGEALGAKVKNYQVLSSLCFSIRSPSFIKTQMYAR